jgi:perosamine synthetase
LGLGQLEVLASLTARRRRHARHLTELLGRIDGITVPYVADGIEHSFQQYSILIGIERFKCSRDEFVEALRAAGIEAAVHYPRALNQQPVFASMNVELPNCEWIAQRIVSLPVHPSLAENDLDRIVSAVATVAARLRLAGAA